MPKTPAEILTFVKSQMETYNFYQPWIIAYLVAAGGSAAVRAIANNAPGELVDDEIALTLPARMRKVAIQDALCKHDIVTLDASDIVTLNCDCAAMTPREKLRIIDACLRMTFDGKSIADSL